MEKTCPRCVTSKDLDDFNYKSSSKDKRQPYCRKCSREDWNLRYSKEERKKRNKVQRAQIIEAIEKFLLHKSCDLCGSSKNLVLQPHSLVSNSISRKYSVLRLLRLLKTTETTILCRDCCNNTAE